MSTFLDKFRIKQNFSSRIRKIPFLNKKLGKTKKELAIKEDVETIIKNLTSDTVKTKLETQFKIFKQELDNRKIKKINELINNKIINLNSNNIFENQNIANKNFKHFDLSIRDTVNNQEQQSSTNLDNN